MTIGILKLTLFIHDSNSLKEKRMVLESLKVKLRNNFNVAVLALEDGDKWQKANLAIVSLGNDRNNLNSVLSKIINFVENFKQVGLIDQEMELI